MCERRRVMVSGVGALLFAACSCSAVLAQEPQDGNEPGAERNQADGDDMPMRRDSSEMKDMARAMESMADMCRMMMEREMRSRPYLLAAGAVLGALLFVALLLFVVLQIQWIRFWSVRIKTERQKLAS